MNRNIKVKSNIRSKVRWGVVGVFALMFISTLYSFPEFFNQKIDWVNSKVSLGLPHISAKPFSLGLDLQGGAHLVYSTDVTKIASADRASAVEGVRDVIDRRINGLGVSEPNIQTTKVGEDYRIIVELPGVTDVNKAIEMIGGTPILEFKEINNEPARGLTDEEKKAMDAYNKDAEARGLNILKEIKGGLTFADAAKKYSEQESSKNNDGYVGFVDETTGPLYDWAKKAKEGELSKNLIISAEGFNVVKRGKSQDGETQVQASHILICYLGASQCDGPMYNKTEALAKANELFTQANSKNFAELAKVNSTDLGTKDKGGDLGFFKKGAMIEAFANAVFESKVGQIIGPIETEFGYHIIYKTDEKKSTEYEISAILVKKQNEADLLPPPEQFKLTGLSGSQLDKSEVVSDPQTGTIQVALQFDEEGKKLFREITTRNVGQPVAIFLDGSPISVPTVQSVITDGRAVITGNFDLSEARLLSQRLNTGALPVPVELISQQTIGASLGADSLTKSLKAGVIALLLVMVFLIIYYRLPGVLAVLALLVYIAINLALYKLMGITLTLAGIAGFIMSVGMSVDANVLVFERMKEELREGKSLKTSMEEGFLRAWPSIYDGNVASLISCVLLIWFGSSFVQGFAMTLIIGILTSMFSAVTVTRVLMRLVVTWFSERGNWMFLGHTKKTNE